jgi:DNA-directed RNA polymerase specialized sigma24 family protein
MGICLRYANNREEAAEVMNQGFYKVYTHIGRFDMQRPFKAWLGRIYDECFDRLLSGKPKNGLHR